MKIKPVNKLCQQEQFEQFYSKKFLKVEEYLKCFNQYLLDVEKEVKKNPFAVVSNLIKKNKCLGDFCKIKVKKIPHLSNFLLI